MEGRSAGTRLHSRRSRHDSPSAAIAALRLCGLFFRRQLGPVQAHGLRYVLEAIAPGPSRCRRNSVRIRGSQYRRMCWAVLDSASARSGYAS